MVTPFQTKRYASGNDRFLFSVFCRIPEKTGNTGAEKLRGRTHPLTHGVLSALQAVLGQFGEKLSGKKNQIDIRQTTLGTVLSAEELRTSSI